MTVSQWADTHLYLSPEDSAESGKYLSDRAPYQRGIMDAFSEPGGEEVVMMSSAQVGKTLILKSLIGYFIDLDPSPILVVQPTIEMGETFSKDRLAPMIRDTPALVGKVRDAKSRDSGNTILKKHFPGGHLTIAGANSAASLSSRPIRVLLCDEVDRYPPSAGTEGDPVNLARKRTATYRARKKVALVSTPTLKGHSRIERAWLQSDQRRYFVPCPHCGHRHVLEWANVLVNETDLAQTALVCPSCGALIRDSDRPLMLAQGQWMAQCPQHPIPGFHLNELYSPWRKLSEIASDFLRARGNPEEEKTWWNTAMGLPFESVGERASADLLAQQREAYAPDHLPAGVLTVTAGVDTQKDRLEIELVGWGAGEESWGIEHIVLHGNPAEPALWQQLDGLLINTRLPTEDGRALRIAACCIDSGGHHVQQVYEFATPRAARNVWAVKGQFGPRPVWPKRQTKSKKYRGHTVRLIGVDTAKDTIYARWQVASGKPGYCHFPMSYDDAWFEQATVEKRVTRIDGRGNEVRAWQKPSGARNEALDCRVYAYAALQGLKIERRLVLAKLAGAVIEGERMTSQHEPVVVTPNEGSPRLRQAPAPAAGTHQSPARRVAASAYLRRR
ncbi:Phage terminase, large subunit GpA [Stutzerimonas balearica DSM 6083]|nr:Phage terminase, large subunit GpA [Stutzerimonas balearica DSM 6083]